MGGGSSSISLNSVEVFNMTSLTKWPSFNFSATPRRSLHYGWNGGTFNDYAIFFGGFGAGGASADIFVAKVSSTGNISVTESLALSDPTTDGVSISWLFNVWVG